MRPTSPRRVSETRTGRDFVPFRVAASSPVDDPGIENGDLRGADQLDSVLVSVAIPVAVAAISGVVHFRMTTERRGPFLCLEGDTARILEYVRLPRCRHDLPHDIEPVRGHVSRTGNRDRARRLRAADDDL